jgi:hypothetical protein
MVAAAGGLAIKMVIAAFAGMGAATICHPMDVIRVQMQTEGAVYNSPLDCGTQIYQKNGLKKGLYAGISAAYLRQWLYGSVSPTSCKLACPVALLHSIIACLLCYAMLCLC